MKGYVGTGTKWPMSINGPNESVCIDMLSLISCDVHQLTESWPEAKVHLSLNAHELVDVVRLSYMHELLLHCLLYRNLLVLVRSVRISSWPFVNFDKSPSAKFSGRLISSSTDGTTNKRVTQCFMNDHNLPLRHARKHWQTQPLAGRWEIHITGVSRLVYDRPSREYM